MRRQSKASLALLSGSLAVLAWPRVAAASEDGLQIIPNVPTVGILIALFVVLVPLLDRLLFKPLLAVLDERAARIEGARARATELAQRAAGLVARHDDALRQAREAAHAEHTRLVEDARRAQQAAVGEARTTAEREIHEARTAIARNADAARSALGAEAEPLAREIASRLLGRGAA